jgi:hypothetical protein
VARVFISYRRNETKWAAGRLYDRLAEVIGGDNLFFDVSNIEPGEDFVARITEMVGRCDVLLAVIGPGWLSTVDSSGGRRLDRPNDLVRIEVRAALERNIRVIPMLVDGASMPDESQLPRDISALARRNAHDVSFKHFHVDLDSFIRVLQRILAGPTAGPSPPRPIGTPTARRARPAPELREMPFSLSLETFGGVATPLIARGTPLPAEASQNFSTAADNQGSVEMKLFAGERLTSKDNVAVGKFLLGEIPAAARGTPQIKIKTTVDTSLILTVTAEDLGSRRKEILDAVDLTRIRLPPGVKRAELEAFKVKSSPRDSPLDVTGDFPNIFRALFGKKRKPVAASAHPYREIALTAAEAARGTKREITLPDGSRVTLSVPPGVQSGTLLRLRGKGPSARKGGSPGDLLIRLRVAL